jgi:acyl dehydratase
VEGEVPDGPSVEGGTRATWRVPGDIGRRYAAVSGDVNPMHLHPLAARASGFPRTVAHGMWTHARALAALEPRLPDAYAVRVAFRSPLLVPATVRFLAGREGERWAFTVRADRGERTHLEGAVSAVDGGDRTDFFSGGPTV